MWEIRSSLADGSGSLTVATTRPETMLGDVAVAVNPADGRYAALIGKTITLPLTGRLIPVIADDYVDRDFGTGAVKITPAHDFNDWQIGQRHKLAPITIFTLEAKVSESRPERYRGLDRYAARRAVLADLAAAGLLANEKPHRMVVPRGGRSGEIVAPMLTDQWFVAMKTPAPATHFAFPGKTIQDLCLAAVDEGLVSPRTAQGSRWNSCPTGGCPRICTGSTTSRIGASRANCGGAIAFRRGTTTRATSTSHATKRRRGRRHGSSSAASPPPSCRTRMCSTPGSHRRCGATRRSAGQQDTEELTTSLPASVLVTGFDIIFFWVARDGHSDDDLFSPRPRCSPLTPAEGCLYQCPWSATRKARRCRSPRGNVLDPLDLIDGVDLGHAGRQKHKTQGLLPRKAAQPRDREGARRSNSRTASRRSAPMRCASRYEPSPLYGRTLNFDFAPYARAIAATQQAVERDALRADGMSKATGLSAWMMPLPLCAQQSPTAAIASRLQRTSKSEMRAQSRRVSASISRPGRSTSSSGTSTATGTWKVAKVDLARGDERRRNAPPGARWCGCWKRYSVSPIRSSHSSPRNCGKRWRRKRAKKGETVSLQPYPAPGCAQKQRRRRLPQISSC